MNVLSSRAKAATATAAEGSAVQDFDSCNELLIQNTADV
jgi:hypothetical protein